jgi:hypothetical protein
LYYNNTQKFTVNSKVYLPRFLYSGWKLMLLSAIVFTAFTTATTKASASLLPNLEQDISISQESSLPVNDYYRTKQGLNACAQLGIIKFRQTSRMKTKLAKVLIQLI